MSFEQAVFEAFVDAYAADTGPGGLVELLNPGGFGRQDGDAAADSYPTADFNLINSQKITNHDGSVVTCPVQITVVCKRDNAFGVGDTPEHAGLVDNILDRMETVFDGVALSQSAYGLSRVIKINEGRGEANPEVIRRYIVYRVTGVLGGSRILNGRDADFTASSWLGDWQLVSWSIAPNVQLNRRIGWNSCSSDYVAGDKTARFQIIILTTASKPTLPTVGERVANVVFTTASGTTYTNDLIVGGYQTLFSRERGGDRDQQIIVYGAVVPSTSGASGVL